MGNLPTSCVLRDREICLPATQLIHPHPSCVLRDGGTCVRTGHSIGQSTYQLHVPRWGICLPATRLINLHTGCILRDRVICLLAVINLWAGGDGWVGWNPWMGIICFHQPWL